MNGLVKRTRRKYARIWDTLNEQEQRECARHIRSLKASARQLPHCEVFDEGYKSLQYIRYADDFIIGMIGNKTDAEALKADLAIFLKEN